MFMSPLTRYHHMYLYLSENMNFDIFVLLNQKAKKQKWQCSENLDLNLTCEGGKHHVSKLGFFLAARSGFLRLCV